MAFDGSALVGGGAAEGSSVVLRLLLDGSVDSRYTNEVGISLPTIFLRWCKCSSLRGPIFFQAIKRQQKTPIIHSLRWSLLQVGAVEANNVSTFSLRSAVSTGRPLGGYLFALEVCPLQYCRTFDYITDSMVQRFLVTL